MTPHSLAPASFTLFSTSDFGDHTMTVPTRAWDGGNFTAWSTASINAGDMIEAFVDLLLPFYTAATEIHQAIVYTMEDAESPRRPREIITFTGKTGTSVGLVTPANMGTYTWRTLTFGLFKLVFLDAPVNDDYKPIKTVGGSGDLFDLQEFLFSDDNAIAGRDDGQVGSFVQATFKISDVLRHAYKLD